MTRKPLVIAGAVILANLGLVACDNAIANDPVSLYVQGSSPQAVQARANFAQTVTQRPPASGSPSASPEAAASAGPATMAGMDMGAIPVTAPAPATIAASPSASPVTAPRKVYDPVLLPATDDAVQHVTLTAKDGVQEIAPGVKYAVWTFGGTAPGPVIHVKQGQTVDFTLRNEGSMPHSIDFHAAETPWNLNYKSINPGETLEFTFKADHPGAFMYHCGSAPAMMHIGDGMYGAIIVDPATPLPPAKEFVLVQSEFYTTPSPVTKGLLVGDYTKMQNGKPDYVVFNGEANQYTGDDALTADPGQLIRLWLVNAGPNDFSAFHVVGAILSHVYPDGNPANVLSGMQTYTIPPGGGAMIELTIPTEGWYPVVSHSFADASKGAMAMIKVGNPPAATGSH